MHSALEISLEHVMKTAWLYTQDEEIWLDIFGFYLVSVSSPTYILYTFPG